MTLMAELLFNVLWVRMVKLTPVWTNGVVSEVEIELKMRFMQYARSERRVQEVVLVKQKKIKIQSFSNGLNHRGSFLGVRMGFEFFAE